MQTSTPRADYRIAFETEQAVYLIDLDLGNRSVTNDAKAVVTEVLSAHPDKRIVYRDTQGRWDELRHEALLQRLGRRGGSLIAGFRQRPW